MVHDDSGPAADAREGAQGPLGLPPQWVDLTRIETELSRLWQTGGEGGDQAITRACALNLVVHVDSDEEAARASETVAHVSSHDPNRAIVVIADPQAESGLDVWISAHCFLPAPHSPQVCCEQITVSARGDAVAQAPGLMLPLLVPDMPVVLWWVGDSPVGSAAFDSFADSAQRVILDSASFADPCERLKLLSERLRRHPDPPISDLNWARLTTIRELTAQFFDAPEMLGFLGRIRSVVVEHVPASGGTGSPAQAVLLLGWLGSRLGWRLASGQEPPIACDRARFVSASGDPVDARIVPVEHPDGSPGSVVGLSIVAEDELGATFSIARERGGDCVETRAEIEGRQPIVRTICPPRPTIHHLICQELEFVGRDRVYEESLELVAGSAP